MLDFRATKSPDALQTSQLYAQLRKAIETNMNDDSEEMSSSFDFYAGERDCRNRWYVVWQTT